MSRDLREAVETIRDLLDEEVEPDLDDYEARAQRIYNVAATALAEHPTTPAEVGVGDVGGLTEAEREALYPIVRKSVGAYMVIERILADRERAAEKRGAERGWDEGFTRGFYDPLAGHGASGHDASESAARNPYDRSAP